MIVVKDGNLPTWQNDAQRLHQLEPENTWTHQHGDRRQRFWWANHVEYEWKEPETKRWRRPRLHFVQCIETWTDATGDHQTTWTWVSDKPFTDENVLDRCNRMARHRWDIEEHILVEKHHGYAYRP